MGVDIAMENGIGRRGFIARIGIWMLVLTLVAALPALSNFNLARAYARKNSCVSNMRTIEHAGELYALEYAKAPGRRTPDLEMLMAIGYLLREPACPSGGVYSMSARTVDGPGIPPYEATCDIHRGVGDTASGL